MNDQSNYLSRPVFISGYHKSGTTLFLSILDGHPELVVIPEELNFYKSVLYEKDKATAIRENSGFKMFLSNERSTEWSHWRTWFREGYPEFDQKKFNQLFEKVVRESKSFKELMLQLVKAFAEVDHVDPATKCHWVSKTPMEEIFFPVMLKMFGKECKFIYVVRDPRDSYTSISRWNEKRGMESKRDLSSIINFCVNWKTRLNKVVSYQKRYKNVCIFRYEDLLFDTKNTLRQLCSFLQIEYSDQLLEPTRHGKQWGGNSAYSEGFKGISQEPVGRFQKTLAPKQRSILDYLLKQDLVSFGYEGGGLDEMIAGEERQKLDRRYWETASKFQLRYFLAQSYIRVRFNFPQLH